MLGSADDELYGDDAVVLAPPTEHTAADGVVSGECALDASAVEHDDATVWLVFESPGAFFLSTTVCAQLRVE